MKLLCEQYPYVARASGGFFKFYFNLHVNMWDGIIQRGEHIVVFSRDWYNTSDVALLVLTNRGIGWVVMPFAYDIAKEIL